jgi:hypothetical protein
MSVQFYYGLMIFAPDGAPTRINNNYQFVGGASAPNKAVANLMKLLPA